MRVVLVTILTLISGCGLNDLNTKLEEDIQVTIPLSIYMELPMRGELYVYDYPNGMDNSYTSVKYNTSPMTLVEWTSSDSFCVPFMNTLICEPIVNYSTYSRDDGSGQQMIYIYEEFTGDTLSVIGCVFNNCNEVRFIVE